MNDNMIISDELLAAFLDGNTNAEDTMRVLKAAEQDEELRELIRIVSEVDEDMAGRKPAKVKELPMTAMAARKKGKLSLRHRVRGVCAASTRY